MADVASVIYIFRLLCAIVRCDSGRTDSDRSIDRSQPVRRRTTTHRRIRASGWHIQTHSRAALRNSPLHTSPTHLKGPDGCSLSLAGRRGDGATGRRDGGAAVALRPPPARRAVRDARLAVVACAPERAAHRRVRSARDARRADRGDGGRGGRPRQRVRVLAVAARDAVGRLGRPRALRRPLGARSVTRPFLF